MKPPEPAYLLAAVRAQGASDPIGVPKQTLEEAQRRALACGRLLVECEGPVPPPAATAGRPGELRPVLTLGWSLAPVPEETRSYPVRRLSSTQSITFAVCLAAAWRDTRQKPYPGEPFRRADIIDTLRDIGADARTVTAALETDLPLLLLICKDGGRLRLGPAVAALPETFAESVRRMHDNLPRPPEDFTARPEDDDS